MNKEQTHPVNSSSFLLSIWSPQHEDDALQIVAEPLHHSVSEHLPAFLFVGVGLVCSDRQHRIEQQNAWRADPQKETTAGLLMCSGVNHLTDWSDWKIPCLAHPVRSPWPGCWKPSMSEASSLYMFSKLKTKCIKEVVWKDSLKSAEWRKHITSGLISSSVSSNPGFQTWEGEELVFSHWSTVHGPG